MLKWPSDEQVSKTETSPTRCKGEAKATLKRIKERLSVIGLTKGQLGGLGTAKRQGSFREGSKLMTQKSFQTSGAASPEGVTPRSTKLEIHDGKKRALPKPLGRHSSLIPTLGMANDRRRQTSVMMAIPTPDSFASRKVGVTMRKPASHQSNVRVVARIRPLNGTERVTVLSSSLSRR